MLNLERLKVYCRHLINRRQIFDLPLLRGRDLQPFDQKLMKIVDLQKLKCSSQ